MKSFVYWLADAVALVGAFVLCLVIAMTATSIVGRALIPLGLAPVPGDFELTEIGMAFAIFCFLPLCQLHAGHATVDVFTGMLGAGANRVILAVWDVVLTITVIFIFWRLYEGFLGKTTNNETTMLLRLPVWWAYGAALLPAAAGIVVGLWSAADHVTAAITGRATRSTGGASH